MSKYFTIWTCTLITALKLGSVSSTISVSSFQNDREHVVLQFSNNLSTENQFFEVYSKRMLKIHLDFNEPRVLVYTSEKMKSAPAGYAQWKHFVVSLYRLCDGNREQPFIIVWYKFGRLKNSPIGETVVTLMELEKGTRNFDVLIEDKASKTLVTIGKANVELFNIIEPYSFQDYRHSTLRIHCTLAIDFSASSKPSTPDDNTKESKQALSTVVSLVQSYPKYQFSVITFGAELSCIESSTVTKAGCIGQHHQSDILQVFDSYADQIRQSKSVNMAPVIRHMIDLARAHESHTEYYYLLIIFSDGRIDDARETIQEIIEASTLPISIVVIGNTDFQSMEALVSDAINNLAAEGKKVRRNIVNFVRASEIYLDEVSVGKEILANIPRQAAQFVRLRDFEQESEANSPSLYVGSEPIRV